MDTRLERLAERLPVENWLTQFDTREVEKRIRRYGFSQRQAKRQISAAKKRANDF